MLLPSNIEKYKELMKEILSLRNSAYLCSMPIPLNSGALKFRLVDVEQSFQIRNDVRMKTK